MAGPYEVVARDGQYAHTKGGSERDMWTAYECARTGHTDKALEIINAYANTLQRFDGHDAPLCAIQAFQLVRAMSILKDSQNESWPAMIRRAMLPTINKFEADSPYANGNWGAIVNRLRMACAIFLQDSALYQASIDYFLHANDNGSLPNYISPTGQCQETGRDQGHAQLGLGALCDICEMAWQQGDDLWGALDNRLMKGIEYTARYNLGNDVPFQTWTDCTGLYNDWTEPGTMGRGRIWDIYQKPYDHYAKVRHLKMPYTKKVLALQAKAERKGQMNVSTENRTFQIPLPRELVNLSTRQLVTYPAPQGAPLNHDYDVYVCPRGSKEWTKVDTYMARVNAAQPPSNGGALKHQVSEISYCVFDFTGSVFVRVVRKNRKSSNCQSSLPTGAFPPPYWGGVGGEAQINWDIRPHYRGTIPNVLNDSTVQFLLFQPENLSVEYGGSITDNLLIFTSKPTLTKEQAEAQAHAQGRTFKYYPPGFYNQEDTIRIPSNTTVYLAGGAYFTSTFAIDDARDVSILGRGIARPARGYEGAHVYRSSSVLIDGLIVNTCPIGESTDVTLHDIRSISHPSWGDGLNVFGGSSNILFDRVFCRNSDDCTTAYATRKGFNGSTRNVTMRNSTLWADVAHPIFIGLHGNSERGDTIENLRYENIDILGQAEPQVDYQGCLAINCGDNNLVRNVTFDNIRIEHIAQGSITHVKVSWNDKYCTAPGRGVEDITFRNIRYYSSEKVMSTCPLVNLSTCQSIINGYNEQRRIRNITFQGLKINGQPIYDDMPGKPAWYKTADYVPIYVGDHVDNVVFTR